MPIDPDQGKQRVPHRTHTHHRGPQTTPFTAGSCGCKAHVGVHHASIIIETCVKLETAPAALRSHRIASTHTSSVVRTSTHSVLYHAVGMYCLQNTCTCDNSGFQRCVYILFQVKSTALKHLEVDLMPFFHRHYRDSI